MAGPITIYIQTGYVALPDPIAVQVEGGQVLDFKKIVEEAKAAARQIAAAAKAAANPKAAPKMSAKAKAKAKAKAEAEAAATEVTDREKIATEHEQVEKAMKDFNRKVTAQDKVDQVGKADRHYNINPEDAAYELLKVQYMTKALNRHETLFPSVKTTAKAIRIQALHLLEIDQLNGTAPMYGCCVNWVKSVGHQNEAVDSE